MTALETDDFDPADGLDDVPADIVDRLQRHLWLSLCRDAADEITRLRAENAALRDQNDALQADRDSEERWADHYFTRWVSGSGS